MWGDESEGVAPIIWLYQTVDAQKEEVFFPDLLITLRSYDYEKPTVMQPIQIKWWPTAVMHELGTDREP